MRSSFIKSKVYVSGQLASFSPLSNQRPVVEFWDPKTGEIRQANFTQTKEGLAVRVPLPAFNSTFVVLRDGPTPGVLPRRDPIAAASEIAITGPWELRFAPGWGAPEQVTLNKLVSWTDMEHPDVKAFSGVATYRTEFEVSKKDAASKRVVLDLGKVKELCELRLNGEKIGAAWHAPYQFELSAKLKAGKNMLEIQVANLWANRLAADGALPKEKRRSQMTPEGMYGRFKNTKPQPSGLLGPVRLRLAE